MFFALLTLLLVLGSSHAEPQQYQFGYPEQYFFRSGYPQPSYDYDMRSPAKLASQVQPSADPRLFFTTLTVTLATSTTTSLITTITVCTTSTSALKTCTPSGRRRRGILVDGKDARALFYSDDEEDRDEEGTAFLPSPANEEKKSSDPVKEAEEPVRQAREAPMVPFVVQPGFSVPAAAGSGRFLLAFGTSTSTFLSTTTIISSLTASCRSTSNFQLCGSSGK